MILGWKSQYFRKMYTTCTTKSCKLVTKNVFCGLVFTKTQDIDFTFIKSAQTSAKNRAFYTKKHCKKPVFNNPFARARKNFSELTNRIPIGKIPDWDGSPKLYKGCWGFCWIKHKVRRWNNETTYVKTSDELSTICRCDDEPLMLTAWALLIFSCFKYGNFVRAPDGP